MTVYETADKETPMPRITALHVYQTKGMSGFPMENVVINPETGIVGDRNFAYARRPQPAVEPEPVWAPKTTFYVGMNTPGMVSLPSGSGPAGIQKLLGLAEPPEEVLTRGDFNMTDTEGPTVSLLNLATLRLFEDYLREHGELRRYEPLNPQRFRMNLQIDDWQPFAELELATTYPGTRQITIGGLRFEVLDACERCKATQANPETGEYDLDTLKHLRLFMQGHVPGYKSPHRGHNIVMGLILRPLDSGQLKLGDELLT